MPRRHRRSRPGPASPAPEVEPVAPRPVARRLDDVHGQVEPLPDRSWLVGVAAEADRFAALVAEPAQEVHRGQRAARVDLERPAGTGKRPEHGPVLLLVVLLDEPVRPTGPVA